MIETNDRLVDKLPVADSMKSNAEALERTKQVVPGKEFCALASQLLALRESPSQHKSIGIMSCSHAEGNSTLARNLAIALGAAIDGEVLLVDCVEKSDNRSTTEPEPGWFDLVFRDVDFEDVIRATELTKLSVMTAGFPIDQTTEIYNRNRLLNVIQYLKDRFEFVVFDLPCAAEMTGCIPIASVLDGVILNLKAGKVTSARAVSLQLELQRQGAHLIGAVVNQSRSYIPSMLRTFFGSRD